VDLVLDAGASFDPSGRPLARIAWGWGDGSTAAAGISEVMKALNALDTTK
jgi:hypothetical protein